MYINSSMRSVDTILLTLDGVLIGCVAEADTKEGWVRQIDINQPGCPIIKREGKVDYVGDTSTDPDWMIAQRMAAIRIHRGLSFDLDQGRDTNTATAMMLEYAASQIRSGEVVISHVSRSVLADPFPLPEGSTKYISNGKNHLGVDFVNVEVAKRFSAEKAQWARENPTLVAEHVRSQIEGSDAIPTAKCNVR